MLANMRIPFAVKNRCLDFGCHPLCVHIPGGAKCICPDRTSFLQDSDLVCDAGTIKTFCEAGVTQLRKRPKCFFLHILPWFFLWWFIQVWHGVSVVTFEYELSYFSCGGWPTWPKWLFVRWWLQVCDRWRPSQGLLSTIQLRHWSVLQSYVHSPFPRFALGLCNFASVNIEFSEKSVATLAEQTKSFLPSADRTIIVLAVCLVILILAVIIAALVYVKRRRWHISINSALRQPRLLSCDRNATHKTRAFDTSLPVWFCKEQSTTLFTNYSGKWFPFAAGKGKFRPGSPGDEGTVSYHGSNNIDLRGAFDYEAPPTGAMVMVGAVQISFVSSCLFELVYTKKNGSLTSSKDLFWHLPLSF